MLLSQEKVKETHPTTSKIKSNSKSNPLHIPMASSNKMAQLIKMMERLQARIVESEKKMEVMTATLQNLIKGHLKANNKRKEGRRRKGDSSN